MTVEIRTGNAAFHDEEYDSEAKAREVKRILKEICEKLDRGYEGGKCMDINGNCVGEWSL